ESAIGLAQAARDETARHVGYYLVDDGRPALERAAGYRPSAAEALRRPALALAAAAYARRAGASPLMLALTLVLALVPASELALTIVNFTVGLLFPPRLLPRLEWKEGL